MKETRSRWRYADRLLAVSCVVSFGCGATTVGGDLPDGAMNGGDSAFSADGRCSTPAPPPYTPRRGPGADVSFTQNAEMTDIPRSFVAYFERYDDELPIGECFRQDLSGRNFESRISAGTAYIQAGSDAMEVNTSDIVGGLVYTENLMNWSPWNPGDRLRVRFSGSEVPGFESSVVLPPRVAVVSPAMPVAGEMLSIPIDRPLTVTWTPICEGYVAVSVGRGPYGDFRTCYFLARAGTGVLPAEVLTSVGAGSGTLALGAFDRTAVAVPGWDIHVVASNGAVRFPAQFGP